MWYLEPAPNGESSPLRKERLPEQEVTGRMRRQRSYPVVLYVARDGEDWVVGESYNELAEVMVNRHVGEFFPVARYKLERVHDVQLAVVRVDESGALVAAD